MKNKKADITLENALTVIIAALGLILLFAGAYKLYQIIVSQEQENAKNFLNVVEAKINALDDGEISKPSIRGVEGWFLTGWGKDDPDRAIDKIECFLDSCICICKGSYSYQEVYNLPPTNEKSELRRYCQEKNKGFCRKIDKENVKVNFIYRYKRSVIVTDQTGKSGYQELVDEEKALDYIILPKNLIELQINKTASEIIITEVP